MLTKRVWRSAVLALIGLTFATPLFAQGATTEPQQSAPQTQPIVAGWQDGFLIQSSNEEYRLVFGMVAQADGRFSLDDPTPITNTFVVRKIRPTFTGRITRYFEFKVMPDFGSGTTVVQDAYVDARFSTAFRVRSGKDKTPVGYELLQGDAFVWFPERSLASSLVPNRDTSAQIQGDLLGARLSYTVGVFNGIPDGTSLTSELDTNNGKDLAGRILVQPFRSTNRPGGVLNNFGFHVGGSRGRQTGALPTFRTSVGQTYFSYATGVAADGLRTRLSPAVFYYFKRFGGFAEYMRSSQRVSRESVNQGVTNEAWQVTGSIMVTGDAVSYGAIRPRNNFNPSDHRLGAIQLLGRYAVLKIDDAVFAHRLAVPTASAGARSFTLAVNWFANGFIKYYATFERTIFDETTTSSRPPENVILFRTQLGF
jgi:phosphate-selective porin OprO and OprP